MAEELRRTFIDTGVYAGKYDAPVDRESAYELLSARFVSAQAPVTQVVQPVPEVQPAPVQSAYQPMVFRVFNPQTGMYEEKAMDNMPAPVQQSQPAVYQQPQVQQTQPQPVAWQQSVQTPAPAEKKSTKKAKEEKGFGQQLLESFARSATTSSGRTLGNQITRSLLGTLGIGKKK